MGNWNNNTWTAYRRHSCVDDCLAFSVTRLDRNVLNEQHGYLGDYVWTADPLGRALTFGVEPNGAGGFLLHFEVINGREMTTLFINQQVSVHSTPGLHGSKRWWMECPLPKNGDPSDPVLCGKRVALLYLPPGEKRFGCRVCHRLSYRTKRKPKKADAKIVDPEALRQAKLKAYDPEEAEREVRALSRDGLLRGIPAGQQNPSGGSSPPFNGM